MSVSDEKIDPRIRSAWRTWLSALAVDAEAAVAAALAYESLAPEGRSAWLDALDEDAAELGVPAIALYSPLLAVEDDEARTLRMTRAVAACERGCASVSLGSLASLASSGGRLALTGEAGSGERVSAIVSPLYLDFVEVLVCRYREGSGFVSARRDPIRNFADVFVRDASGECVVDGVAVTEVPLRDVVEDLSHAVVADRREKRAAPEALEAYVDLFVPDLAGLDLHVDSQQVGAPGSCPSADGGVVSPS